MRLPAARGPLSQMIVERLVAPPAPFEPPRVITEDPLFSEDIQLALFVAFEVHYGGFDEVDEAWEWHPSLIAFRNELVRSFEAALEDKIERSEPAPNAVESKLKEIAAQGQGPSLSSYLRREATLEEFREFVAHRSIYHLREADPHTWVIPRLYGQPKAALIEIQADEYGGGQVNRMHSSLFAGLMKSLRLSADHGAYLDRVPATTLATVNLMSVFSLHRRRRGASVGHLALLEMDSSIPNQRYADGLRRLGFGPDATRFYDEHVEADSVHEAIAAHDLAGALAKQQPELASDIVFGAEALVFVEGYFARCLLGAWGRGRSSLLPLS